MGQKKVSRVGLLQRIAESNTLSPEKMKELFDENKTSYLEIAIAADDLNLLDEMEQESMLPMEYTVVKRYLWTHLQDAKARKLIDRVVEQASRMYAVGTRFLGGWVLENKQRLAEPSFFSSTLQNTTFIKHAFRGYLVKGGLHPDIEASQTFKAIKPLYPITEQLAEIMSFNGWDNIVGALATAYKAQIILHVKTHLWVRIQSHLKNYTCAELKGKLVKVKNRTIIRHGNGKELLVSNLYDSVKCDGKLQLMPESVQREVLHIRSFFTDGALKKLPDMPKKMITEMFQLHLYLRENVPFQDMPKEVMKCEYVDEQKLVKGMGLQELPESVTEELQEPIRKGWSPVPISRLGRIHVTIDKSKVLPALLEQLGVDENTTIEKFFGIDTKSIKEKRKELRKRLRKIKDKKKRSKHKKSLKKNGYGIKAIYKDTIVRSVTTDGVALCVRYGRLKKSDVTKEVEKKKEEETLLAFQKRTQARLIADDRGRVNMFQIVEKAEDGSYHYMRLTRRKYKVISLSERFQHLRSEEKKMNNTLQEGEGLISQQGGWKARNFESYLDVVKRFVTHGNILMQHYGDKKYSLQKMVSYRRCQSVMIQRFARIVNRMKTKGLIYGIGDARFAPTGKGETAVPTTRMSVLFARFLKAKRIPHMIVPVDEWGSTQGCHKCGNRLANVCCKETGYVLRGLKSCRHCAKEKTGPVLRNRDANAARNILLCLEAMVYGTPRPAYLCRSKEEKRKRRTKAST